MLNRSQDAQRMLDSPWAHQNPHPIDAPMLTTINLIQSINLDLSLSHASLYSLLFSFFLIEIPLCFDA